MSLKTFQPQLLEQEWFSFRRSWNLHIRDIKINFLIVNEEEKPGNLIQSLQLHAKWVVLYLKSILTGYNPRLGRTALFWEKSPLSCPWLPEPYSARHQILPLCPLWFMASKQKKISAKSLSPKADICWGPCLVAEEQTPHQGHWAGVPVSASCPWLLFIMAWGSLSLPMHYVTSSVSLLLSGTQQPSWTWPHAPGVSKSNAQTKGFKQPAWSLQEQVPKDLFIYPTCCQSWQDGSQLLGCSRLFTLPHVCHQPRAHPVCMGGERSEKPLPCEGCGWNLQPCLLDRFYRQRFCQLCLPQTAA